MYYHLTRIKSKGISSLRPSEQATEGKATSTSTTASAMTPCLIANPPRQKLTIREALAIYNLCRSLSLARVET